MAKNVTIGNRTYTGINKIKVKDSEIETYHEFFVTDDATATATDIVSGKTAYIAEGKVEGTLEEETKTVTPNFSSGNVVVTPTSGKVMTQVTINKDSNLIADNIKKDVTIFGVTGTLESTPTPFDVYVSIDCTNNPSTYYIRDGQTASSPILKTGSGTLVNHKVTCTSGYIYIDVEYTDEYDDGSSGVTVDYTEENVIKYKINQNNAVIKVVYDYCFVKGTKITLADGNTKNVEDIEYTDKLLVWNFDDGKQDVADIVWIAKESKAPVYWEVTFSDNTKLGLVGAKNKSHRLFNLEQGKFAYPQDFNEGEHTIKEDGSLVTITSCVKLQKEVTYYNLATFKRLNNYANGILTGCRFTNIYPIKNMKYIKDNRKFVPREEYQEIPDNYFYGLRLAEQPKETNANDVNYFNTTKEHVIHNYIEHEKYWTGEKDYKSWEFKKGVK